MTAEATEKKQETRLYIVPKRGVIEREGGKRVVVIVDGKVQTKPVTVVREVGADVYISAGLNGSESIIVSESDKLKVGDRVESKENLFGLPSTNAVSHNGQVQKIEGARLLSRPASWIG